MRRYKKLILIVSGFILLFFIVIILFISPIAKYVIEKYDMKIIGREITMNWAYVNPFTGYVHLSGVVVNELDSEGEFFTAKGISADFSMLKLLSKTYQINRLTLNEPYGVIIQTGDYINFSDLIDKFSPKDTLKKREPVHFNILNIRIKNGEFHYSETVIPIKYFIKNFNLKSTGIRWDVDSISSDFSFTQGTGSGDVKGDFMINIENKDYRLAVLVEKLDLNLFQQYLRDLTNYGTFTAILDADMKSRGNLADVRDVTTSGYLNLSDFHFGKNPDEDYASFDNLVVAINEMSPQNQVFNFDSIALTHPFFKYERYDYLDNLQTMFGKSGANIEAAKAGEFNLILEIADYIKALTKNFFQSNYHIDRLAIYNADIKYTDFSLSEKFTAELNPLTVIADSIDKNRELISVSLNSGIKPYGNLSVNLSINPRDSSDFDLQYHLGKLPAPMFNPYIISQTSFPLDRGTIEINGNWRVRNGNIQSKNHLVIIDPRLAKRIKNDDLDWIPLKPVMTLVRERGNIIDYEIPIKGNLKDPKIKIRDVIVDILENIFVKPVTTNYIVQVRKTEKTIEKSLSLTWRMNDTQLEREEEKFLEKLADYLKKSPGAAISIFPNNYAAKEKEYILLYATKKKFYLASNHKEENHFDQEDSMTVQSMSIRDSAFLDYLDYQVKDSLVFTIQEQASRLTNAASVNERYSKLNRERENLFMNYFKSHGVASQVTMNKGADVVPYNGFSFYRVDYKGELPDNLMKAYQKIDEYNNKVPRKKFIGRRTSIQSDLKTKL